MTKSIILSQRTQADIESRVARLLDGLGNPEPPIDLNIVRDLLQLDKAFYSADDPSILDETISRLRIAGKQVIARPTLLLDAVRKLDIKALYIPDQKRILLDENQPILKHRWSEVHEIGHSLLPWHHGAMLGDNKTTLTPACHDQLEAEANTAAANILFLGSRFSEEAKSYPPSINSLKTLKSIYGNTYATTLWRCIESWGDTIPILGLITDPLINLPADLTTLETHPCKHFIQSPAFASQFSRVPEMGIFERVVSYCAPRKGGPLGESEIIIQDDNSDSHIFQFESFSFSHNVLTIGVYRRAQGKSALPSRM